LRKIGKTIAVVLLLALCFSFCSVYADTCFVHPFTLTVTAGSNERSVRALNSSYNGNVYICLGDLSAALNGTKKQFSITYSYTDADGNIFNIKTGAACNDLGVYTNNPGNIYMDLLRNRIFVNGSEKRYYTFRMGSVLYMSITDIQLLFDFNCSFTEDGVLAIDTGSVFTPDIAALSEAGYFDYFTGIVVGDAATGDIFFSKDRYRCTSIASTSKLMTYLLVREAMDEGIITANDIVTISQRAAELSTTEDGAIEMTRGMQVPMVELLEGLLLASSNECAVALAEHVSGSVEEFVELMNKRAGELGLTSSVFYNPHGLPFYVQSTIPAKLQNMMTADDMFRLSAYILDKYPDITDITSMIYCTMPTLKYTTANSNPLVFNLDGVNGLKTGSTNRAGSCLVASIPLKINGEMHNIIVVLFGAETASERGQAAHILLKGAAAYYCG